MHFKTRLIIFFHIAVLSNPIISIQYPLTISNPYYFYYSQKVKQINFITMSTKDDARRRIEVQLMKPRRKRVRVVESSSEDENENELVEWSVTPKSLGKCENGGDIVDVEGG
jgi:hypothetical protein